MSRVYRSADPDHVFRSRPEIEDHLLAKIAGNAGSKIGTELELFVTTPEGRPLSFPQVEMLLEQMAAQIPGALMVLEKTRIVGLSLPGLGDVSLEPGGQVELSTKPCADLAELDLTNRGLRALLERTAAAQGLRVEGAGHKPSFLEAEDMPRSRFAAYGAYLTERHGKKADDLVKTMKSCCGLQVNVDPMGPDFHEIYRALLLVDVAHSLSQLTVRQNRLHETYAKLAPEQLTPVFEALKARSNEELMGPVVDRLLGLSVPFVPDKASPEGFKSTAALFGQTPTVGGLLQRGALTAEILDNALALQLTMPNLRHHGVVETRAPDSPQTTEALMATAAVYHRFAYEPEARRALLEDFADLDPALLKAAFTGRFDQPRGALQQQAIGGGKTVADLIRAVEGTPAPAVQAKPQAPRSHGGITPG